MKNEVVDRFDIHFWCVNFSAEKDFYSIEFVIISVLFDAGPSVPFSPSWKKPLTKLPRKLNTGRLALAVGRLVPVVDRIGRAVLPVDVPLVFLHLYIDFSFCTSLADNPSL